MEGFVRTHKKVGKPVIWINEVTGDYKIPPTDDVDMPLRYKMQGFVRREFTSYHEHKAWMKSKGLVNHASEGVRNDDDLQLSRWGY